MADSKRKPFSFSVAASSWDPGRVTVSLSFGEYDKVGRRDLSFTLRRAFGLDGSSAWALAYEGDASDEDSLRRLKLALGGKDAGKWLVDVVTRLCGITDVQASEKEAADDARYYAEKAESEECDAARTQD